MKVKIAKREREYIYILTELYNIVTAKNNIFNITYLKSKIKNKMLYFATKSTSVLLYISSVVRAIVTAVKSGAVRTVTHARVRY